MNAPTKETSITCNELILDALRSMNHDLNKYSLSIPNKFHTCGCFKCTRQLLLETFVVTV